MAVVVSPRAPKHCGRSGCPTLVRGRTYCDDHTPEAWSGGLTAQQGHGTTRAQRALVAQVLAEEPTCACGAPSTEAGHIVPRSQGGRYVRDNLKGQCRPCNVAQIKTDRRQYGGGTDDPRTRRARPTGAAPEQWSPRPPIRTSRGDHRDHDHPGEGDRPAVGVVGPPPWGPGLPGPPRETGAFTTFPAVQHSGVDFARRVTGEAARRR